MEPWEDELLLDDDFSDEEENTEAQIEETSLEMDADGFADWEDTSDGAPVDETLEEALAEEHTLELESELEQDEHPRDYHAELEDEEEEAAPTSEKRLKREIRAEALRRLEEAARTESDFLAVVDEWNKLDRNRERRERDHENLRGDVPLEFQAVPEPTAGRSSDQVQPETPTARLHAGFRGHVPGAPGFFPACSTRLPQSENPIPSALLPPAAAEPLHEFPV